MTGRVGIRFHRETWSCNECVVRLVPQPTRENVGRSLEILCGGAGSAVARFIRGPLSSEGWLVRAIESTLPNKSLKLTPNRGRIFPMTIEVGLIVRSGYVIAMLKQSATLRGPRERLAQLSSVR